VTPFSPRALDRGLAGVLVGLARLGVPSLTPASEAKNLDANRPQVEALAHALVERAAAMAKNTQDAAEIRAGMKRRVQDLLDEWSKLAAEYGKNGVSLQYNEKELKSTRHKPLLYDFLSPKLGTEVGHKKFRAGRSMREVEHSVNLFMLNLNRTPVEGVES